MSETTAPAPIGGGEWLQRLWREVHRRRWQRHAGRQHRLPVPVVSVGNLHWGGTGKTPLVAAVAAHLREAGWRVAILSRGYGRRGRGPRLVSAGDGPRLDPWQAGDEPWLLADALPGVAVAVGERRRDAAALVLAELSPPPTLFLLDDAFSHLALARDLDLLVLPAGDPFGGGRLPPRGRLREPLASAARAHAALLVGAGQRGPATTQVAAALAAEGFAGPVFACPLRSGRPRPVAGSAAPHRPLLVTGIADPDRVRRSAEAAGLELAGHLVFPDHHRYPPRSLRRIHRRVASAGADGVATTAKDRSKLQGRLDLPLLELQLEAVPENDFWRWLEDALGAGAAAS